MLAGAGSVVRLIETPPPTVCEVIFVSVSWVVFSLEVAVVAGPTRNINKKIE